MKRNKYGAIKTTYNGIKFDSKLECERYKQLKLLEAAGQIRGLQRQVKYPLVVNEELICTLIIDHLYFVPGPKPIKIAEDTKGFLTPYSRIKMKLAVALYPGTTFKLWPDPKTKPRKKSLKKRRV